MGKYLSLNGLSRFIANMKAKYAPINSPAFTGNPTCSTPASGTNTTRVINTGFVQSEISDKIKKGDLVVYTAQITNMTISDYVSSNFSVAKSGYTTIGVTGWDIEGNYATYCLVSNLYTSGNTCYYQIRPRNGNANTITFTVYILYRKN